MTVDADEVLAALAAVRDPELDEPVTALGFVAGVEVKGDGVTVRLRLPTYFCAPNFAWLMVADAQRVVAGLPGVGRARVMLDDHFATAEIDRGVEAGAGFAAAFAGEAEGELDELRSLFDRKALLARQHAACAALLRAGRAPAELAEMTLGDLPAGPPVEAYRARRAALGLDASPGAPLLVTAAGVPVPARAAARHLAIARATRVSLAGNASLCRGLLETRYGQGGEAIAA
jgi:metal-sulfur cluster biosynthetic enzyme